MISKVNLGGAIRSSIWIPMLDPSLTRTFNVSVISWELTSTVCLGTYSLNSSLLGYSISVLTIIGNRLVIIWVLSIKEATMPRSARLIRVVDLWRFLYYNEVAGTCSKMYWLVTLRSCAVVLTIELHVRSSHSLVVHPHGGGSSKTFIRWTSDGQAAGVSTARQCQLSFSL